MPTSEVNRTLIGAEMSFSTSERTFCRLAQGLAATLVFEHGIRQLERVPDAVRIEPRTQSLGDEADVVVLKILGDARHERHTDRRGEQQADAAEKLTGGVLAKTWWRTGR